MVIEFITGKIKMGSKSNRPLPTHRIVNKKFEENVKVFVLGYYVVIR